MIADVTGLGLWCPLFTKVDLLVMLILVYMFGTDFSGDITMFFDRVLEKYGFL